MLSWLSNLFSKPDHGQATTATHTVLLSVDYQGYRIDATPMQEGGQYRLAGRISKRIGDTERQHQFIRADLFTDPQQAAQLMIDKAKIAIDQQGDALFLPPPDSAASA
ncbi:HlyU family transcriptional regulator [Pseudaeromonas sharmana]|uniref:HlyU family transcriptional regulator n=1 Tax=Pseudaeromonas sharmana TaxID=328412 RepID=A0ABV8CRJ9_9GAMM